MKCWCFNSEQLDAALAAYRLRVGVTHASETTLIGDFLLSPEAREHKLTMHGIWDRQDPSAPEKDKQP